MICNWGDLITLEYGKPVPDKESVSGKVPVYGTNGRIGYSSLEALCPIASFILGRKGAYRGVHYSSVPFSVIDTAFYALPKIKNLDMKWVYYKFLTYDINSMDSGSAIPSTDRYEIYSIELDLPDIEIQQKTVATLSCLDDKIELNTRIIANLEAQAQTIFKSWFVDFEPFQDGEFEDSELGMIPKGWRVVNLGSFFPVKTGKKDANVTSPTGEYPFFSCAQNVLWTNEYSFDTKAILVAGNGDFNVKWYCGKFEAYQRTYVLIPKNEDLLAWLYYVVSYGLETITSKARGSVIKFITKGNIEDYLIAVPQDLVYLSIIKVLTTINLKIEKCRSEISSLQSLRDTLLPKLTSGEIEVPVEG